MADSTSTSTDSIAALTAVGLRDALAGGELSAVESTEHFLSVIEAQNKHLGAFITVTADQALEDARAADHRYACGRREDLPCSTECLWPSRT